MLLTRYAHLPWRKFEDYKAGTPAILIGWGWEATIGSVQNQLKMAHLLVFSKKECARRCHKYSIHATNMCAGIPEGGRGQCYVRNVLLFYEHVLKTLINILHIIRVIRVDR